jgi:hypothetical protein
VDDEVAQFVKWATRIIASTFIFQVWHVSRLIPLHNVELNKDF